MTFYSTTVPSPIGPLLVVVDADGAVVRIDFPNGASRSEVAADLARRGIDLVDSEPKTRAVRRQLDEYFAGERQVFDLPLAPDGTDFQRRVWRALVAIPYGETRSYGELAALLGRPGASRAVGRANATNPIPIVVPCHRVIGADGSLTGFGGGLPLKRRLLDLERERSGATAPSLFAASA
jgi:methylated-DNA-[protein]-cysteine S-methyltransferase